MSGGEGITPPTGGAEHLVVEGEGVKQSYRDRRVWPVWVWFFVVPLPIISLIVGFVLAQRKVRVARQAGAPTARYRVPEAIVVAIILLGIGLGGADAAGLVRFDQFDQQSVYNYSTTTSQPDGLQPSGNSGAGAVATTGAPSSQPQYTQQWTLTSTEPDGTSESAVLSVGTPEHFSPSDTTGSFAAGSACNLDPQTDAVVPAQLVITNTTPGGFSEKIGAVLTSNSVQWEVDYSSGAQCGSEGSGGPLAIASTDPVAPNATVTTPLFFVLSNYYTPNQPQGNTALLATAIGINGLEAVSASQWTDTLGGPGVEQQAGSWWFTLSGQTPSIIIP